MARALRARDLSPLRSWSRLQRDLSIEQNKIDKKECTNNNPLGACLSVLRCDGRHRSPLASVQVLNFVGLVVSGVDRADQAVLADVL